MPATLINAFIVPADKEEEFLARWRETTTVFSRTPGFIEAHLHKNTGVGNGTFSFINIAKWQSAEAWQSTHATYTPREYAIPGVKPHPAIYEPIIDFYQQGDK